MSSCHNLGPQLALLFPLSPIRPTVAFGARSPMADRFADGRAVVDVQLKPERRILPPWYTTAVQPGPTNDTDPRVEAVLVAGYRAMSASQKLARVTDLTRTVQQLALLDIRRRHPHAAQRELALRLASRWIDPDLMKRAFDWDARAAGF